MSAYHFSYQSGDQPTLLTSPPNPDNTDYLMGHKSKVGIEVYRGRLRLRLPSEFCDGQPKVIYTRQYDTEDGWRKARQLALLIEMDVADNTFDLTLARYKSDNPLLPVDSSKLTLLDIWDRYCEYRKPQLSITHYEVNYRKRYRNTIIELPNQLLTNGVGIRDYLLHNRTPGTAKQLLIQFNAACKWAVKSKLTKVNPFEGMAADIRNKRQQEEDIDPFTAAERDAIIAAFEEHPHHRRYAGFVRFLFLTGCRTSEAVGLRWGDVNTDCSLITFSSVISKKYRKGTKTGKSRRFPCGASLSGLLQDIRPTNPKPDDLVFPNTIGTAIRADTFLHNAWKGESSKGKTGIVTKLVLEGKVERYRPQYNTQHTFITECLEQGITIPQIARWVGNSASTILAHYGGVINKSNPPEF